MTEVATINLATMPRSKAYETLRCSGFQAKSKSFVEYEAAKNIFASPYQGTSSYDNIVKVISDYLQV